MRPGQLLVRLLIYYGVLIGAIAIIVALNPGAARYLPIGGDTDISLTAGIDEFLYTATTDEEALAVGTALVAGATLMSYLLGAVLAVIPITWVYMGSRQESGYRRNLVRALIVLPICAASTVLLIKDSLALAFGLAALVAAVRFRVRLSDPLDGIYILASIAVGLAAGIGYVGIGVITAFFFSVTVTLLWLLDYGRNPVEDQKLAKKAAGREQAIELD